MANKSRCFLNAWKIDRRGQSGSCGRCFCWRLDLPELHFGWLIPRRPAGFTQGRKKELPSRFCIEPAEVPATFLYGLD
jgi:hypothetical protein